MQSRILYHGPAAKPYRGTISVVLFRSSSNPKTGDCLAIAILPGEGVDAVRDRSLGLDRPACGTCPLRSIMSGGKGGCYVSSVALMGYAGAARSAWDRPVGIPADLSNTWPSRGGSPLPLRLGAYGDPAAIPPDVVGELIGAGDAAGAWTWGYTHGWRHSGAQHLRDVCMASVESEAGHRQAVTLGWRVYRIVTGSDAIGATGLVECESAIGTACTDCGQCRGSNGEGEGRAIVVHGPSVRRATEVLEVLS